MGGASPRSRAILGSGQVGMRTPRREAFFRLGSAKIFGVAAGRPKVLIVGLFDVIAALAAP
eukprot:1154200-Pyramimonas_sp.AAC.1